eukprot:358527-Chlamydomonas_euryale.AAC.2
MKQPLRTAITKSHFQNLPSNHSVARAPATSDPFVLPTLPVPPQVPAQVGYIPTTLVGHALSALGSLPLPLYVLPQVPAKVGYISFTLIGQIIGVLSRSAASTMVLLPIPRDGMLSDRQTQMRLRHRPQTTIDALYMAHKVRWGRLRRAAGTEVGAVELPGGAPQSAQGAARAAAARGCGASAKHGGRALRVCRWGGRDCDAAAKGLLLGAAGGRGAAAAGLLGRWGDSSARASPPRKRKGAAALLRGCC